MRAAPEQEQLQDGRAGCLAFLILVFVIQVVVGSFLLLALYGAILLIFRHAFGVELPNPIDYIPSDWRAVLPRSPQR